MKFPASGYTTWVKTSIIQDVIKKVDEMDRLELIEYISLLLNHIEELEGVIE